MVLAAAVSRRECQSAKLKCKVLTEVCHYVLSCETDDPSVCLAPGTLIWQMASLSYTTSIVAMRTGRARHRSIIVIGVARST